MLKGTMFITDNIDVLYNTNLSNTKIINLDEDGVLGESKDIIGGTCLLPPMEAKIAEADGNEQMYDTIYSNHLLLPHQLEFISALIAFLYKGGNLLLFLPELGYNHTTEKLIEHLYVNYGLHPGLIGSQNPNYVNCFYDERCIPMWLNLIYTNNIISPYEYLYQYPIDAPITNNQIKMLLIEQVNPYGKTIQDRWNYIERFRKLVRKNPKVVPAIGNL